MEQQITDKYARIEGLYQKHFVNDQLSMSDAIKITQAVDAYGEDIVLAAMRELYAQRKTDVRNFGYISAVAKRLHRNAGSGGKSAPVYVKAGGEEFQTENEREAIRQYRAQLDEQRSRRAQLDGVDMRGNCPEAIQKWVRFGGKFPRTAYDKYMCSTAATAATGKQDLPKGGQNGQSENRTNLRNNRRSASDRDVQNAAKVPPDSSPTRERISEFLALSRSALRDDGA